MGEGAATAMVEVAGQTGISDSRSVNWFVGVTPEYSCAVRHGQSQENLAPEIFASIMEEIYRDETKQTVFPIHGAVREIEYCKQSAMAATDACPTTEIGYYAENTQLPQCKQHTSQESRKGEQES